MRNNFFDIIPDGTLVIGTTGHRDVVKSDEKILKNRLIAALLSLKQYCFSMGLNKIILLSGLADGCDLFFAEAAFETEIPVYGVLATNAYEFEKSISAEYKDRYLTAYNKCEKVFIAPDVECFSDIEKKEKFSSGSDYLYRQEGAFIAACSDLLFVLWDGKITDNLYGCGTEAVVKMFSNPDFCNNANKDSRTMLVCSMRRAKNTPEEEKSACYNSQLYYVDDFGKKTDFSDVDFPASLTNCIKKLI